MSQEALVNLIGIILTVGVFGIGYWIAGIYAMCRTLVAQMDAVNQAIPHLVAQQTEHGERITTIEALYQMHREPSI